MENYWKHYYDSNSRKFGDSPLKQVGKTVHGREISEEQVELIVHDIAEALQLGPDDSVIDLCCGNGLITKRLAPLVKEIVGVDFTPGLIDTAKRSGVRDHVEYINSNVLDLAPGYFSGANKVVMYEALQHFSSQQCESLLDNMKSLAVGALVLFGSVPDGEKLRKYYDTDEKFSFYEQREKEGRPHIGRWWLRDEMKQLVAERGFEITFLPQNPLLYTAYYRFNVLLKKRPS